MNEFIANWLPIIVSAVCSTAVGVAVKVIVGKMFDKSKKSLNEVTASARDTEKKAITLLNKVDELKEECDSINKDTKETLSQTKTMLETNKSVLEEMNAVKAELISLRNELNTIKRQQAVELRRGK